MNATFLFHVPAWLIGILLLGFSIIIYQLGIGYKTRILKTRAPTVSDGQGLIEGAMLGLTALLLSFTFNMSASKFNERQKVIIEEANDIGTAILRCDLYTDTVRT